MKCPHCGGEVALRKADPRPRRKRDGILGLLELGASEAEIARALGISRQRVHQIAKDTR